ncbi:MAG: CopG family ribbon-helix-helix protein [Chthoniobacterales bacterium]
MVETLSIKVPKTTKTRLRALARARKTSPSALLREAIEQVLNSSRTLSGRPSLHQLSHDLFENLGASGPKDLSSNPKYMEGFGR